MFNVLEIRIKVYQYITLKLAFAKIFQYHKIQGVLDLHLCLHEICVHGRSCNMNFRVKCATVIKILQVLKIREFSTFYTNKSSTYAEILELT